MKGLEDATGLKVTRQRRPQRFNENRHGGCAIWVATCDHPHADGIVIAQGRKRRAALRKLARRRTAAGPLSIDSMAITTEQIVSETVTASKLSSPFD